MLDQAFMDILENALYELIEKARSEINVNNADVKEALDRVNECSRKWKEAPNLDAAARNLADDYAGALGALSDEQQKHLYIQGAKDCVEVLRKLGVIK